MFFQKCKDVIFFYCFHLFHNGFGNLVVKNIVGTFENLKRTTVHNTPAPNVVQFISFGTHQLHQSLSRFLHQISTNCFGNISFQSKRLQIIFDIGQLTALNAQRRNNRKISL
ncbi:hypothetical protein SDC9_207960 [bioreactor metagenome]|uniref:Uncharacterized protein n=1 Tax=bioreactor metagenome TaxID=1076179 RepID=A0A645J967_9ZZZZ